MDLWRFLMEVIMLLGTAFFLGALAQRLRQSPIIGYLVAGTLIGPLMFNAEAVNQTAELGVALLLFSIGLEFSFGRLRQMGRMAFGGGTAQVLVTMGLVVVLTVWRTGLAQALTLGAIVALSSTAVVVRILVDRAEIDSVRGRNCLAILLLQDIAIVPLVLMVSLFSPAAGDIGVFTHILKITAAAIGLTVILYLLLYKVVPILLSVQGVFANRELTVLLAIVVGIGAAWAAHSMGISPALGAFVAGLLLGESPFATQIQTDIGPLRTIMVTLFFASVGMLAKPMWFLLHVHWIVLAATAIFVIKSMIIYGVGRLFNLDNRQAMAMGITLGQIGEFSFVLASTAGTGGILGPETTDLIISVIIVLMFAAPYMVSMAFPLTDRLIALIQRRRPEDRERPAPSAEDPAQQVLVVGLGPAGGQVIETLLDQQWEPVVIDINPESRRRAQEFGIAIHLGDATNEEILAHAGLGKVCMAVVTVPDPGTAIQIVKLIRRMAPSLFLVVRCRYNRRVQDMQNAGADVVIDEEKNMGKALSRQIIDHIEDSTGMAMACRLVGQEPETAAS